MKTGIIVLNYNDSIRTIECVERINNLNFFDYIVVVDNASTDNSIENFRMNLSKNIKRIYSSKNDGYAAGNNIGLRYLIEECAVDLCYISNPDVTISSELVNDLKNILTKTEFSMMTGVMHEANQNMSSIAYWKKTSYFLDLVHSFWIGRKIFKKYNYKNIFNETIVEVDVIPGSFFAIKSNALIKINYLDEDTFLYYEEDMLSRKLSRQSMKIGLLSNRIFIHDHIDSPNNYITNFRMRDSMLIYQKKYNRVGKIKFIILLIASKLGIYEKEIINYIKKIGSIKNYEKKNRNNNF